MQSGWQWPSNAIIQPFTTNSCIDVLMSYCGIQQVIYYKSNGKQHTSKGQAYQLNIACSQTLRAHAPGNCFYGKKLYLQIYVTPEFQLHKIQQNSCCGILGYSCLQPQLRVGCVHNSARMGADRSKASDTASFSQVTQERRLASGCTVTMITGAPSWRTLLPGKEGTIWSNMCHLICCAYSEKQNCPSNPSGWLNLPNNLW